jgi:hypothetical protein
MVEISSLERNIFYANVEKMIEPFRELDRSEWFVPWQKPRPDRLTAWHSRDYTVQSFAVAGGITRLAIHRSDNDFLQPCYGLRGGIPRDAIAQIKQELGFGALFGVEIYPPQPDILNVADVRHLWLLPASPLPEASKLELAQIRVFSHECFEIHCYASDRDIARISVRTNPPSPGSDISWDVLQQIKDVLGVADRSAFELYPASGVIPLEDRLTPYLQRHLWLLPERFPFEWRLSPTGEVLNTGWE